MSTSIGSFPEASVCPASANCACMGLPKNALAFCSAIEKAGYRAGVYFNQRFGYEEFDLESLQDYVFWLAEYNETPSFSYHFQLWQYCNDGRVDGIQTDVDLNLAFLRAKH